MNIGNYEEAYAQGVDEATEAVAGDPSAWYVRDKNGEKVHIGDKVDIGDARQITVMALRQDHVVGYSGLLHSSFKKVILNTRENIIEDMIEGIQFWSNNDPDNVDVLRRNLDRFYDRIKAVEA